MRCKMCVTVGCILIISTSLCFPSEDNTVNESSKYLDAVREFADNVLKYGRDTYGPKHTPLFVDGLNIHTHEPVKWIAPREDTSTAAEAQDWILCNLASQQNLFRVLDGLSKVTGNPKYRQAAMKAIEYAFANLRSPNGLLCWGNHTAYDLQGDRIVPEKPVHILKAILPHYELMWQVNPEATKKLIESFWSAHVRDWTNLDMDRIGQFNDKVEEPWNHEYELGPVFLPSDSGTSFSNTGTDLLYAASMLTKLSGDQEPLLWAKRLAYRYVRTRHPKTGISYWQYSKPPFEIRDSYDNIMKRLAVGTTEFLVSEFPWYFHANTLSRENPTGQWTPTPGVPINQPIFFWQTQFLVGEMLGEKGNEFKQWALEEFTAFSRTSYRKLDNCYVPILSDGTNIEGYVVKVNNNHLGPKGGTLEPVPLQSPDLWAHVMAYRVTRDACMWEMSRNIAEGNKFGDIGETPNNDSKLNHETNCANPYALLAFLELYRATSKDEFLHIAGRIGDNLIATRFHKGFFVASNEHIYTKFDAIYSLALLRLHSALAEDTVKLPEAWPSLPYFICPYRWRGYTVDNDILYARTESGGPPLTLNEAASIGDIELVGSLIDKGDAIDVSNDGNKTALQCAAMNGQKDVVELLLAKGARIDAQESYAGRTALHYAAEKGHKGIVELLINKGADINAKITADPKGDTPLHSAVKAGHREIIELLIDNGADVNAKGDRGGTPIHLAVLRGHKEIVEFLITSGADVNVKDDRGNTPLLLAERRRRTEIVEILTKAAQEQTTVEKKTSSRQGPVKDRPKGKLSTEERNRLISELFKAIQSNNPEKAKEIIAQGPEILLLNVRTNSGDTLLIHAIKTGSLPLVETLIAGGAGVSVRNRTGDTPLHSTALGGYKDVVELLIASGADVNAKDRRGNTPLNLARQRGHTEIIDILTKAAEEQATSEK